MCIRDRIDPVTKAFVHGLRALGYIEGQNLVLERRSAEGRFERIDEIAAELAGLKLDVIVTGSGDFMAQALQRVTKSVPIVVSGTRMLFRWPFPSAMQIGDYPRSSPIKRTIKSSKRKPKRLKMLSHSF